MGTGGGTNEAAEERSSPRRIAADLESRGVSSAISDGLADRLVPLALGVDREGYEVALAGAAAGYAACRAEIHAQTSGAREVAEIERLMRGLADELRKLEEGLQMVTTYVLRMQERASRRSGR